MDQAMPIIKSRIAMTRSSIEIDAEREQAVKDTLDAVGYPLGFFRDYDEPNDSFKTRLVDFIRCRAFCRKEGVL